ncbi:hypothetical protein L226DRAFT_172376 [Lentinus tigrinus ALCF2SS1-7]|uniref:uncharacterized protein n=1 Tax=Lentinus tigrinus ALCF2SS1-7 TaxID=1328758 RepID=UPI001165DED6|nr:hypothetical protein L226DRAFT_172376 [Lentinus tigrinus ALCF2SS1-7]
MIMWSSPILADRIRLGDIDWGRWQPPSLVDEVMRRQHCRVKRMDLLDVHRSRNSVEDGDRRCPPGEHAAPFPPLPDMVRLVHPPSLFSLTVSNDVHDIQISLRERTERVPQTVRCGVSESGGSSRLSNYFEVRGPKACLLQSAVAFTALSSMDLARYTRRGPPHVLLLLRCVQAYRLDTPAFFALSRASQSDSQLWIYNPGNTLESCNIDAPT